MPHRCDGNPFSFTHRSKVDTPIPSRSAHSCTGRCRPRRPVRDARHDRSRGTVLIEAVKCGPRDLLEYVGAVASMQRPALVTVSRSVVADLPSARPRLPATARQVRTPPTPTQYAARPGAHRTGGSDRPRCNRPIRRPGSAIGRSRSQLRPPATASAERVPTERTEEPDAPRAETEPHDCPPRASSAFCAILAGASVSIHPSVPRVRHLSCHPTAHRGPLRPPQSCWRASSRDPSAAASLGRRAAVRSRCPQRRVGRHASKSPRRAVLVSSAVLDKTQYVPFRSGVHGHETTSRLDQGNCRIRRSSQPKPYGSAVPSSLLHPSTDP
jgi:hypothetical protein